VVTNRKEQDRERKMCGLVIANGEGRMCEVNGVFGFECCISIIFSFLQLDVIILYLSYLVVEKVMHFFCCFYCIMRLKFDLLAPKHHHPNATKYSGLSYSYTQGTNQHINPQTTDTHIFTYIR
jgi:hypothetical protein